MSKYKQKGDKKPLIVCPECDNKDKFYWAEQSVAFYDVEVVDGVVYVHNTDLVASTIGDESFECGSCRHRFINLDIKIDFDNYSKE